MAVQRMDHVVVVVPDLDAAIAFFTALGLEVEGGTTVEGEWVDRVNGIAGVRADITMMRTPDGHGRLEVTRYASPAVPDAEPEPPNRLGLRSVMFEVDDLEDTLDRLRPHGGTLIGAVARYEDSYVLCYVRGPGGVIVALAEAVG
ncbi:MAG TPA: VOC family protein [Mycobacteriales bacterium]|jgi:catechol 2,3-dioxygenase-like lactoylglutathione lyase family enzyme